MTKTYIIGTIVVVLVILGFVGANQGWFGDSRMSQSRLGKPVKPVVKPWVNPKNPTIQKYACCPKGVNVYDEFACSKIYDGAVNTDNCANCGALWCVGV